MKYIVLCIDCKGHHLRPFEKAYDAYIYYLRLKERKDCVTRIYRECEGIKL